MPPSLFPQEIIAALSVLRPVFHAASYESFVYLILGLLLGQAQAGIVRASLWAPSTYNWRRIHDFVRRNRWSEIQVMGALVGLILESLYPKGVPSHLFWVLDPTHVEKLYAQHIEGILLHFRPHRKVGQGRVLKGHGFMLAGHLYEQTPHRFRALLVGGLLYVKQASWVEMGTQLTAKLPFPKEAHNVLVTDRGLTSIKLARALRSQDLHSLGRIKANATFYLPAAEADYKGRGRRPIYGPKFRADSAPKEYMTRLEMDIPLNGKLYPGVVYRGTFLRRGFTKPVELLRVEVGTLPPWLLMLTDPTLATETVVFAYYGRSLFEVAIEEAKALGLGAYRGRREKGVRRWPMIIGVVHSLLQLIAVGALKVELPAQRWPWYPKETTVGSIQRRFIQWIFRRHFSTFSVQGQKVEKMTKAS